MKKRFLSIRSVYTVHITKKEDTVKGKRRKKVGTIGRRRGRKKGEEKGESYYFAQNRLCPLQVTEERRESYYFAQSRLCPLQVTAVVYFH